MKLQYKFGLGIIVIFCILSIGTANMCIRCTNDCNIRAAENRVEVYIKAAWTIHDCKISRIRSVLEILTQNQEIIQLLRDPGNRSLLSTVKENLEAVRKEQVMDILTIVDSNGKVVLRTRPPYNQGDNLSADPMVKKVIFTGHGSKNNIILSTERLDIEGEELLRRCIRFGGEPKGMLIGSAAPVIVDGNLIGVIQMGNLLNGATGEVDRIREGVFENKYYKKKPIGTATIFMGDLRISTNVLDDTGKRAIGTRVSKEVAEHVLKKGLSWTGRAWVVNAWYLSRYDPIKDPDNNIIGMLYVGELEQKYLDMRTQVIFSHLSVIFFGLIFAIIVTFFITKSMLKPIQKLSYATKGLSNGDMDVRVAVNTKDEVGSLSNSFNYMAQRLQKQHLEIQRHQEALEKANQELKTINRNYMEMLGFVSHELKNPLSSAVMALYTVKDGYLGELNASQKQGLEPVARSLDYFHDMIKNYLDLSRLEKGEFNVNKRGVILHEEVLRPLIEELQPEIQQKKIKVENHIPHEMELYADKDLLIVVYDNLLANAIKYGKESGTIVLDAHEDKIDFTMSVYNEGQGIPRAMMSALFKKFSRINTPEYAGKKGTGLGLYICKEIIEKQGGKIWAESEEGKWARFTFTLPKNKKENKT